MEKTFSNNFEDHYEVNNSLGIVHYKQTKEILLVNFDTGEEFLIGRDYEEAIKVCEFLLLVVKEND